MNPPLPSAGRGPRRFLRVGLILLATGALLAGAAWWAIPALLQSQLPPRLGQALGRPVSLQAVTFEPGRLALRLQGLQIGAAGAAPADPLLHVQGLLVDFGLVASLRQRAPVIEALAIDGLQLRLARTAPGHYDIDDLITRLTTAPGEPASPEPVRFALNNLALRDAQIRFDDQPAGRVHEVQALTLTLPFLSSLADDAATPAEPRLSFTVNGTRVDTRKRLLPFAPTRSGDLTLAFADLDLKPWLGYLPASLPVRLQRGRLGADLTLHVAQAPQGAPTLQVQGRLALDDLALTEPDGTPLAAWRALKLELRDLQPLQRRASLGTLRIDGAALQLSRDARGLLNLQRLQPAAGPEAPRPAASASTADTANPWQIALAALQIEGARVDWHDATLRPAAGYRLDGLGITLRDLQWPLKAPMPLTAQASLHAAVPKDPAPGRPAAAAGQLRIEGQVSDREATLALRLDGLALDALAPYARQALRPRLSGRLSTQAQLRWAADPAVLALTLDSATLQGLQLRDGPARAAAPLASLRQLQLSGATIDLLAHRLAITKLQITQPSLALSRSADGQLNVAQWLPPAAPTASPSRVVATTTRRAATTRPEAPWNLALQDLSLSGGRVTWSDATVTAALAEGPLRADITDLKLRLQGLAWPASPRAPLPRLQLTASVGLPAPPGATLATAPDRGDIDWSGRIGLAPLQADGRLKLRALPVHLAMPYAGNAIQASLRHADLSLDSQLKARSTPAGWQVRTDGDLQLNEVMVQAKGAAEASGDALLSWQSLSLQGLVLALAPPARPRIEAHEQALSDFYSRLVLDERGHLNLADLAAPPPGAASAPQVDSVTAAVPGAAVSAPPADTAPPDTLPIDLVLGPTQLRNGRIDFSDYFIKPNYSARMTELNGLFGAFRSGTREMAALTMRGRVADTALLDISGQLNPTVQPLALDIRARATDLELAPLSPYAGKYAGYAIERGKLSMDVAYKIEADGKLEASNQVILSQLTFGERVESPSATQLPVLLAVALLKDRNGVIDINLPVSGSVNDPQFSVGGIVWKVILNLLGKALTAPFALLAGGGSDDLSQVGFQPGTARFTDAGRQSLDKVAKALANRPSLMMTVTGAADTVSERTQAQRVALEERLQAEQHREQLRAAPSAGATTAAAPGASAPALPPLSAGDRTRLLKRLYQQTTLPDKPRNTFGLLRDLPPAEMENRLRAAIRVTDDTMRELALQRGLAVRDALISQGLPSERLFLAAPKLRLSGEDDAAWQPQVTLTLSAK